MEYTTAILRMINLYLFSEQLYIHASINSANPVFKKFYEQCALNRMEYIEELEAELQYDGYSEYPHKKLKDLYRWHKDHYGENSLRNAFIQDLLRNNEIDPITIDIQALEICDHLLTICPPGKARSMLHIQVAGLEAGIVYMATFIKYFP